MLFWSLKTKEKITTMPKFFNVLLIVILSATFCQAQISYLHCGQVYDMTSKKSKSEVTIIVDGERIQEIRSGYIDAPRDATSINLKDKTVLPGLMDMHVHIEHESSKTRYMERFSMEPADVALRATQYCRRTLMAGFTTVRDLGGTGVNVSLKKSINSGVIEGPRIYTSEKSLATTGGHADPTNGVKSELRGDPGPSEGVINSVEDAYKAVRQRYKNGADVIKITATGGVLSVAKDGSGPQFTVEEVEAVVAAANDYGMVTAAHAHGAEGMKRAVLGGIHSIEHGTYMNEEVMDLMIERGTYYVPTIIAGKFVAEKAATPGFYPTIIVPKALAIGPQIQSTFEKAHKYGVKIAFGTDSGVSYHGDNGKEFGYMVEAGMSPIQSLITATVNAADLLRISKDYGTLEVGKIADIIAVGSDPVDDISVMEKVDFVMKGGVVYKN